MANLKIEIKWAIIFTIVGLLWMLLEKLVGLHDKYLDYQMYLTNLFAIPAIIVMVMALRDKKKNYFNGNMNYKQGFISGLLLSVFIAVLSPISQWITSYIITPDYFNNAIKRSVEIQYYKTIEEAEGYFNFQNYVIQGLFGALVMGIVTTSIIMIFLRSKNK